MKVATYWASCNTAAGWKGQTTRTQAIAVCYSLLLFLRKKGHGGCAHLAGRMESWLGEGSGGNLHAGGVYLGLQDPLGFNPRTEESM